MTDSIIAKESVLIIEDEATQLRILQKQLERLGFNVFIAPNGNEGIQIWRDNTAIRIVITDLEMPEGDGFDVLRSIRESESRYTYIMVLTNMEDKDSLLEGLSLGADDFVHKPVIQQELDLRLKSAKRLLRLEDHDKLVASLARFAAERTGELDVHLTRTKEYCAVLATDLFKNHPELGLTEEVVKDLANISVLHDLGKICIPDGLLHKRGNYTAEEQKIIESHTLRGGEIFQGLYKDTNSIFLRLGYEMVLGHHEMWDGRGSLFGSSFMVFRLLWIAHPFGNDAAHTAPR